MKKRLHRTHILIILGLLIIAVIFVVVNLTLQNIYSHQPISLGVSYSPEYAEYLGLGPKQTYQAILSDLHPKKIRLAAYWDKIEPEQDQYSFTDLDYYINEAGNSGSQVILAVGYKLPRWPECRFPLWLDSNNVSDRQDRELKMLRTVVGNYADNPYISSFQLENEPLLPFGVCPKADPDFLKKEVTLLKSLTKKPLMITDSGELQAWTTPMSLSDIFGTTLYRKVKDPIFGEVYYPFPPWSYQLKSNLIRNLFARNNQETIISELQAEPWTNSGIVGIPIDTQLQAFSLKQLQNNVNYAKKTGFPEILLWGVEWWYYLAANGHPEYLEFAKTSF